MNYERARDDGLLLFSPLNKIFFKQYRGHIANLMDHSPIQQTFIFENNFSTVGKSFLILVKLLSLVEKYSKISKIYSPVKFANFVYYYITNGKALPLCGNVLRLFPRNAKVYKNSQTLHYYIFDILQYFATKLHNSTKFRKLFQLY